ncbi:U3 small nucleolar ribonucleoprotein MPP10 [Frankliniella fusca]|uniref:U3 small nucleolar ribonucleoprotein protein MPP10 n=1 Tax=Frankliniella fusca TaxID=407009 RepID=A0AAE1LLA1_9NEOP|nr:U3 small nucleolar ribonucleoprotein MPP10 [Frankliniella fusca]
MAAAMATTLDCSGKQIALNYDDFTKKCENYVSANDATAESIKTFLKSLYGVVKETEEAEGLPSGETLPELIVDNFDEEQIWQELDLQNEARVDSLVGSVARLVAQKDKFSLDKGLLQKPKENGVKKVKKPCKKIVDEDDEDDNDEDDDHDDENSSNDDFDLPLNMENESDGENQESGDEVEEEDQIDEEISEDSGDESSGKKGSKKAVRAKKLSKPSAVDDKFFKLSEMEEFLEREEREDFSDGDDSSEDSIDLFDDIPSDESDDEEEENNDDEDSQDDKKKPHYSDFFDAPEGEPQNDVVPPKSKSIKQDKKRKVKFDLGNISKNDSLDEQDLTDNDSDSGSEDSQNNESGNAERKSSYEIRQERLQAKIKKLEEEALSEKPWQLRGEVTGESRPENALLEEALEFDLTHRPAPVVTEETTQRLEDIIKQRIKDKAWDDVERKVKPVEVAEFKKKLVLDQEKSKLSLSQVYEQEYLKQVEAKNPDSSDKPEEIPKEHLEIKSMVDSLFRKLDALSNFHFTPKQVAPEIKIVTNIPAINMEEVAPVATSDATLLAPEEVKAKPKGDVKSQGEKTDTDRKRERRQKKKHQRLVGREREKREATVEKLKPGLGNKYSKEKAVKMLEKISKDNNVSLIENTRGAPAVKSSTTFFSQLQDEVNSQMKDKAKITKKRKADSKTLSAKRLKL